MARSLEQLQKQYNSASGKFPKQAPQGRRRGPMPPGMGGKPKDTKKTVLRLLKYIQK